MSSTAVTAEGTVGAGVGAALGRVYVSAGEPSGDAYLADLVEALRGLGGGEMVGMAGAFGRAQGVRSLTNAESLTALGFAEAVRTVPAHLAALRRVGAAVRAGSYDVAVLVDYPGYHLRVARRLRRAGTPVLQYVAPQLWAWAPGRIRAWRTAVDHCAAILPFEADYLNRRGLPTTFVGHPLLDRLRREVPETARRRCGVEGRGPVLALFPGSRPQEIARLWPPFRDAAARLRQTIGDLEVVVAATHPALLDGAGEVRIVAAAEAAMTAADAVLCKSGTSTLLAALCRTPMVVAYRAHPWSFAVARRLVTIPRISLVNLIAGREVVPELLQTEATPRALAEAVLPLLRDAGPREAQLRGFEYVESRLGGRGAARRVAALAGELGRRKQASR